jgi:hypothetical protein
LLVLMGSPLLAQRLPDRLTAVEAPVVASGASLVGPQFLAAYRPGLALLGEPHRCSTLKKGLGLASMALGGAVGGYLGYKLILGVWSSTSSAEDRRALRQAVIGGAAFGLTLGIVRLARHQLCDPLYRPVGALHGLGPTFHAPR